MLRKWISEAENRLERKHTGWRPSSQHKGDLFASEGQRAKNKRQRQEIEGKGEGREQGRGSSGSRGQRPASGWRGDLGM